MSWNSEEHSIFLCDFYYAGQHNEGSIDNQNKADIITYKDWTSYYDVHDEYISSRIELSSFSGNYYVTYSIFEDHSTNSAIRITSISDDAKFLVELSTFSKCSNTNSLSGGAVYFGQKGQSVVSKTCCTKSSTNNNGQFIGIFASKKSTYKNYFFHSSVSECGVDDTQSYAPFYLVCGHHNASNINVTSNKVRGESALYLSRSYGDSLMQFNSISNNSNIDSSYDFFSYLSSENNSKLNINSCNFYDNPQCGKSILVFYDITATVSYSNFFKNVATHLVHIYHSQYTITIKDSYSDSLTEKTGSGSVIFEHTKKNKIDLHIDELQPNNCYEKFVYDSNKMQPSCECDYIAMFRAEFLLHQLIFTI